MSDIQCEDCGKCRATANEEWCGDCEYFSCERGSDCADAAITDLEAADAAYTAAVQAAVSGHGDWTAVQVAGHAVRQARSAKKEAA